MPPETRSRGVPPPSRVYHSTPSLRQVQFPARRRTPRITYGKRHDEDRESGGSGKKAKTLRQQTLTQIDWVSSFEGETGPIVLSDSEEDGLSEHGKDESEDDKENRQPRKREVVQERAEDDEDEEPVQTTRKRRGRNQVSADDNENTSRSKRRRTLGDKPTLKEKRAKKGAKDSKTSRRKTMGDTPTSSYHTQTLTQFLGRDHAMVVQDSADEGGDDGFEDWLQDDQAASSAPPRSSQPQGDANAASSKDDAAVAESRQASVVPQTPAKRTIRFEIPSSSQQSTSLNTNMLLRYGPPDVPEVSPSSRRRASPGAPKDSSHELRALTGIPHALISSQQQRRTGLVIEDSFATVDTWASSGHPSSREPLKTLSQPESDRVSSTPASSGVPPSTPTRPRRPASAELGDSETAAAKEEESSRQSQVRESSTTPRGQVLGPVQPRREVDEIPDSDEDEDDFDFESEEEIDGDEHFDTGHETQLILNQVASSVDQSSNSTSTQSLLCTRPSQRTTAPLRRTVTASTQQGEPSSPELPPPRPARAPSRSRQSTTTRPLRRPILHVRSSQSQPLESQRVPLATIQGLGAPSLGTDLLLPVDTETLSRIVSGHQVHFSLPFRLPHLALRVWLFERGWLRYMACVVDAHREPDADGGGWRHTVGQVYELNNPLEEQDMRDEGWLHDSVGRYSNVPPAVVAQLLANLRHALFGEDDETQGEEDDGDLGHHDQVSSSHLVQKPAAISSNAKDPRRSSNKLPSSTPASSSFSISQQVEAQLRSDIANSVTHNPPSDDVLFPSTPEKVKKREEAEEAVPSLSRPSSPPPVRDTTRSHNDIFPPPPLPPTRSSARRSNRQAATTPSAVRPSQATTASQASTPETSHPPPMPQPRLFASANRSSPTRTQPSSSLPSFQDYGSSPSCMYVAAGVASTASALAGISSLSSDTGLRPSQLLTKSQMLPDSLLRDGPGVPAEIWDSEDDDI